MNSEKHTHHISFHRGRKATVIIPGDLTPKERKRMCGWLDIIAANPLFKRPIEIDLIEHTFFGENI